MGLTRGKEREKTQVPASRRRVDTYPLANPQLSSCADQKYNLAATKQCTHRVDGPVVDLCLLPGHGTLSLGAAALKHIPDTFLKINWAQSELDMISWRWAFGRRGLKMLPEAVGEVSKPMKL